MNDMLQLIMNRRSVRKYTAEPVPEEALADILEAGRWAPTGGNSQTVHFTVITNEEVRTTLRAKVKAAFAQMEIVEGQWGSLQSAIRLAKKGTFAFDYHAPILIVVSNQKGYGNAMADSACALQNMMLEAESLGIGACWMNQLHWLDENESVRAYLEPYGIGADETICGALGLGCYEKKPAVKPRTGMKVDYIR